MNKFKNINKTLVILTTSDVFTWGFVVVINAFAGIYLETKLNVNAIQIVGIGTGIYSIVNGLLQIPVGYFIDKYKGTIDDIIVLFCGNILMGTPFLFFPIIQSEYAYYFLQLILGIGTAMNLVAWRKTFASNLDKNKEGLEYGIYQTVMSISIAIFGFVAGAIANISEQYFDLVMVTIGTLMASSGGFVLLLLKRTST
ncbi:MAG: hypothetical protein Kow0081_1470 [Candidatus Dojkabacteria bacterium]